MMREPAVDLQLISTQQLARAAVIAWQLQQNPKVAPFQPGAKDWLAQAVGRKEMARRTRGPVFRQAMSPGPAPQPPQQPPPPEWFAGNPVPDPAPKLSIVARSRSVATALIRDIRSNTPHTGWRFLVAGGLTARGIVQGAANSSFGATNLLPVDTVKERAAQAQAHLPSAMGTLLDQGAQPMAQLLDMASSAGADILATVNPLLHSATLAGAVAVTEVVPLVNLANEHRRIDKDVDEQAMRAHQPMKLVDDLVANNGQPIPAGEVFDMLTPALRERNEIRGGGASLGLNLYLAKNMALLAAHFSEDPRAFKALDMEPAPPGVSTYLYTSGAEAKLVVNRLDTNDPTRTKQGPVSDMGMFVSPM